MPDGAPYFASETQDDALGRIAAEVTDEFFGGAKKPHEHRVRVEQRRYGDDGMYRATFCTYECLCSAYTLAELATAQTGKTWKALGGFMDTECIGTREWPVTDFVLAVPGR